MREREVPSQVLGMMNKERDWTCSKLGGVDIEYLKNLPSELKLEFDGERIHAFHATPEMIPQSSSDEAINEKLMVKEADIYPHIK
ncbi:hypothetical protein DFO70_11535 [Cytobacillus firmus]|uniref:Uncharacterized protein n=2 Tax=Cytobacillus TaxID=2675230 RepID=A0A366JP76_CYTFI|nr:MULTISPECIES: hypothetical protein [Cytobacillus]RBP88266.1 hypothetical protein DFO70_11535 [Cytobacillus firmus]TDX38339.1 hypothetical protein DFO72_11335 [Cytobacillus oceanisediminis]